MGEMDGPASMAVWNVILLALGLALFVARRPAFRPAWFAAAIVLFNVNVALVLDVFGLHAALYGLAGADPQFNWAGKLLALVFTLAVLAAPALDRREAGLRLTQAKGAWMGWAVLGVLVGIDIAIALMSQTPAFDAEAVAYQLTMPSLEEEAFYRGVFLLALVRAFGPGTRRLGADLSWGAGVSLLMFALIHSLFWTADGLAFSAGNFLFVGFVGALLTWLRLNTGSILAPVLLHSAVNTIWRVI